MVVSQWKERLEHVRLLARMIVLEGNVSDMFIQENGLKREDWLNWISIYISILWMQDIMQLCFLIESILSIILMIEPAKC